MDGNISEARQRAHSYIKYLCQGIAWDKDLSIDDNVADFFSIPLADLKALNDGTINPSAAVVDGIKRYFKDCPDSLIQIEIQQFLVDPFIYTV